MNARGSFLAASLVLASAAASAAPMAINFDGGAMRLMIDRPEAPPPVPGIRVPARPGLLPGAKVDIEAMLAQLAREHKEIPQAAARKALYYWRDDPGVKNKDYVAIVDFDRPSTAKRMSIIRMSDGGVQAYFAAHGSGSGGLYATKFSNEAGTHMSSLGIYLTGEEYDGDNGRSMKLRGMESTNSAAESRSIVLHPADYATQAYIDSHGMLGRSWGCPAVEPKHSGRIIDQLMDGAVLLLYKS